MGALLQDLRYALRGLRRSSSFTVVSCAVLGVAIGLNTSLFTVFNTLVLRPWPVHDPGRVVSLFTTSASGESGYGGFSVAAFRHLREHSRTLSGALLTTSLRVHLGQQPDGEMVAAHAVSGEYFRVLGVPMGLGRDFAEDEDRLDAPVAVAVLSHRAWQSRFGGDPAIVGQQVRLDDVPFAIIGVADEGFTGISLERHDLWVPLAAMLALRPSDASVRQFLTDPLYCCATMAGRLTPGVTAEQARVELTGLLQGLQAEIGERPRNVTVSSTAFFARPDAKLRVIGAMGLLFAALMAVLLLACANVGNLLLARAAARRPEIATRTALGASRGRLVRQLLTESLVLASLAGSLGFLLAYVIPGPLLTRLTESPLELRLQPDTTVLLFAVGIALVSVLAFGLAPALHSTRVPTYEVIKQHGGGASPRFLLRGVLLGTQVAVSVVLLVSAGILLRGVQQMQSENPGFATTGISMISVELPVNDYDDARARSFFSELAERLESRTGGAPIGFAALAPLGENRSLTWVSLPGAETGDPPVLVQPVSAEYFEVLEIPVVMGRNLVAADSAAGAVLVNETLARRLFADGDAVGRVLHAGGVPRQVVGVVHDARVSGLGTLEPILFEPYAGGQQGVVVLRTGRGTGEGDLVSLVRKIEPRAVASVTTMAQQMERWVRPSRSLALLAAVLGLLALVLATVGVYGVFAYSVEQRRREIGVRLAMGASPREIVRLIVRTNSRALFGGTVVGAASSLFATQLLRGTLPGVSGLDPLVWSGVLAMLFLAGVAASVVPARRAAGLDPMLALRSE